MSLLTWLITGGSSGIGLSMSLAAQKQGHQVIATARNPTKASESNPEFEKLGGRWVQLDVTDPDTEKTVRAIVKEFSVDVVVNNAGYALIGAFEDMSESEIYDQMNTNFFGVIRVMQGAIPVLRERKAGTIVNVSSGAAFLGLPSRSVYTASKSALEGLSEAVSAELADFNIRVIIVDLGAFRTPFPGSVATPKSQEHGGGISEPYTGTAAETVVKATRELVGAAPGDPDEAANRIIEAVTLQGLAGQSKQLRLILGNDCLIRAGEKIKLFQDNVEAMKGIAPSTDFK